MPNPTGLKMPDPIGLINRFLDTINNLIDVIKYSDPEAKRYAFIIVLFLIVVIAHLCSLPSDLVKCILVFSFILALVVIVLPSWNKYMEIKKVQEDSPDLTNIMNQSKNHHRGLNGV